MKGCVVLHKLQTVFEVLGVDVRVFSCSLDAETEERAQRAIEQFFASNLIVPSPWSDPQKPRNKPVLPATPANQGIGALFAFKNNFRMMI